MVGNGFVYKVRLLFFPRTSPPRSPGRERGGGNIWLGGWVGMVWYVLYKEREIGKREGGFFFFFPLDSWDLGKQG